jgi:hypothetical protein
VLNVEEIKEKTFFSVIGTCGVSWSWPNSTVMLLDEILV